MLHIDVLTDTGSHQLTRILAGVYGQYEPQTNKFVVAPEFYPVSPLFAYIDRTGMPLRPESVAHLEVPEGKAILMRAQLMLNLARRWDSMYRQVAPSVRDMAAAMTAVDASMVANGVRNHLITNGMRGYMVPVRAIFESENIDGAGDERTLIANLQSSRQVGPAIVCADEPPVDCGSDVFSSGPIQFGPPEAPTGQGTGDTLAAEAGLETGQEAPQTPAIQAPAWAAWECGSGMKAEVAGTMLVCAQSPAGAIEAANWMITQQQRFPEMVNAQVAIMRVLSMEAIAPAEDQYDYEFERDR